jgi:hypothetical protein
LSIMTATPHDWTRPQQWQPDNIASGDISVALPAGPGEQAVGRSDRFEQLAAEILTMLAILVEDRRAAAAPEVLPVATNPDRVVSTDDHIHFGDHIHVGDQPDVHMTADDGEIHAAPAGADPAAIETVEIGTTEIGTALDPALWAEPPAVDAGQAETHDEQAEPEIEAVRIEEHHWAEVLHVGCGAYGREKLPPVFHEAGWREIRLDIDPGVNPDFVASITDMGVVADATIDAVYSSHNIEHLYPHEVPEALREMRRVLNPSGFALIKLPDLQEVARHVAEGHLEEALYTSPMGAISPLDIMYGHRASIEAGNVFMAHRTGFTLGTLGAALVRAGFAAVMVQRNKFTFSLAAVAFKTMPNSEQMARAQALILPDPDLPAVLYTPVS